ncbi:MAG: hypothetical protein U0559_11185 [Anaerolineae bacterium]
MRYRRAEARTGRNIDARLSVIVGQSDVALAVARLRGVSTAQLFARFDPADVQDVFVIQRRTELLIAHRHAGDSSTVDSGLISACFDGDPQFCARFIWGGLPDQELNTIQYGNQSILLQSDQAAYLAVVIMGNEPAGFRIVPRCATLV